MTLLNNLKVQERQNRVCTTVAIAIVAETCAPFTVLPALMNEYKVSSCCPPCTVLPLMQSPSCYSEPKSAADLPLARKQACSYTVFCSCRTNDLLCRPSDANEHTEPAMWLMGALRSASGWTS